MAEEEGLEIDIARGPRGTWGLLGNEGSRTRTIAYASAAYMALADGRIDPREHLFLRALQASLRVRTESAAIAHGLARWIHSLDLPAHRAFDRLVVKCAKRYDLVVSYRPAA